MGDAPQARQRGGGVPPGAENPGASPVCALRAQHSCLRLASAERAPPPPEGGPPWVADIPSPAGGARYSASGPDQGPEYGTRPACSARAPEAPSAGPNIGPEQSGERSVRNASQPGGWGAAAAPG